MFWIDLFISTQPNFFSQTQGSFSSDEKVKVWFLFWCFFERKIVTLFCSWNSGQQGFYFQLISDTTMENKHKAKLSVPRVQLHSEL